VRRKPHGWTERRKRAGLGRGRTLWASAKRKSGGRLPRDMHKEAPHLHARNTGTRGANWRKKIPMLCKTDSLPRYVELIVALVDPVGAVTVTVLFAACGGSQNPQAVNRVVNWLTRSAIAGPSRREGSQNHAYSQPMVRTSRHYPVGPRPRAQNSRGRTTTPW
jgi:hypothetical protein